MLRCAGRCWLGCAVVQLPGQQLFACAGANYLVYPATTRCASRCTQTTARTRPVLSFTLSCAISSVRCSAGHIASCVAIAAPPQIALEPRPPPAFNAVPTSLRASRAVGAGTWHVSDRVPCSACESSAGERCTDRHATERTTPVSYSTIQYELECQADAARTPTRAHAVDTVNFSRFCVFECA